MFNYKKKFFKYIIMLFFIISNAHTKENDHHDDYYLNTEEIKKISIPKNFNIMYDDVLELSKNTTHNPLFFGHQLDIRPPVQILKVENVNAILKKEVGYLSFEKKDEINIWKLLIKIIKEYKIPILNVEENKKLITDLIDWEKINKTDHYYGKYIFIIKNNEQNKKILAIYLIHLKDKKNDVILTSIQKHRYTVLMLNKIIIGFDTLINNKKNHFNFKHCDL